MDCALGVVVGLVYYVVDPTGGIEHNFFWRQVPRAIAPILGRESRSFVHITVAAAVWAIATAVAVLFFSRRGLQIADTQKQAEYRPLISTGLRIATIRKGRNGPRLHRQAIVVVLQHIDGGRGEHDA